MCPRAAGVTPAPAATAFQQDAKDACPVAARALSSIMSAPGLVAFRGHEVLHQPFRAVLALVGACVICLTAAACGSSGGVPFVGMSGKQVLDKAISDLKSSPSFTESGTAIESGSTYIVNLGFEPGKGCIGTVTQAGKGSYAIVLIGTTTWVKPDDAFWEVNLGNSQASHMIALQRGRYLEGSTADIEANALTKPCDLNAMTSQLTLPLDVVIGKVTTVNGQHAVPLTDKVLGGTLYVTDASTPQVLQQVNNFAGNSAKLNFNVGAPVTVTAPPASQTMDGSQIGF
jgi:hypothetical protein